ncbi:unnamed protein product [Acanthoscelides obtectus]|uniref:Uncharacterized protein n=1 Tax=Acanthoscelides obtectus TaxID=200917 RepID=A0A9P0L2Q9_ACAOB|nr:unnamed protein product [Acanthoscelides obtectus]CAK1638322.1 hypothetical protein AOBTE_LOCUS10535 [Acanthoscelides obtectus]
MYTFVQRFSVFPEFAYWRWKIDSTYRSDMSMNKNQAFQEYIVLAVVIQGIKIIDILS